MTTSGFILVSTAGRRRLVHMEDVREIVSMMALEPVEEAAGRCRGLANLRGQIIPVFDTTDAEIPLHPSRFIVVSGSGRDPVGIIVDEIHDVIELAEEEISEQPVGRGQRIRVARLGDEIVSVLAPADVLGDA